MTLEYNMLGNNMQITWSQSLKNTTISQNIGRKKNMMVLIWNGIMKKDPVEQLWMDISWSSETNMDIWHQKNHNIPRTNTDL